jgi:hypothetical protein
MLHYVYRLTLVKVKENKIVLFKHFIFLDIFSNLFCVKFGEKLLELYI